MAALVSLEVSTHSVACSLSTIPATRRNLFEVTADRMSNFPKYEINSRLFDNAIDANLPMYDPTRVLGVGNLKSESKQ